MTFGHISLVDLHVVEETLRYTEEHGANATYNDLVDHLSWYWQRQYKPKGWVLAWIKCLTGEL